MPKYKEIWEASDELPSEPRDFFKQNILSDKDRKICVCLLDAGYTASHHFADGCAILTMRDQMIARYCNEPAFLIICIENIMEEIAVELDMRESERRLGLSAVELLKKVNRPTKLIWADFTLFLEGVLSRRDWKLPNKHDE